MTATIKAVPAPLDLSDGKAFVHNDERQEFFNLLIRVLRTFGNPDSIEDTLRKIEHFKVLGTDAFLRVPRLELPLAHGMFKYIYEDQALEIFHEEVVRLLNDFGAICYYANGLECPEALIPTITSARERVTMISQVQNLAPHLTYDEILAMLPPITEQPTTRWEPKPLNKYEMVEVQALKKLAGLVNIDLSERANLEILHAVLTDLDYRYEGGMGDEMAVAILKAFGPEDVVKLYAFGHEVPHQWAPEFDSANQRSLFMAEVAAFCTIANIPIPNLETVVPTYEEYSEMQQRIDVARIKSNRAMTPARLNPLA